MYGIESLPEAKIGPVKWMPKREVDSCGLHVLTRAGIYPRSLALAKATSALVVRPIALKAL